MCLEVDLAMRDFESLLRAMCGVASSSRSRAVLRQSDRLARLERPVERILYFTRLAIAPLRGQMPCSGHDREKKCLQKITRKIPSAKRNDITAPLDQRR